MLDALDLVTVSNRESIQAKAEFSREPERSFFNAILAQYAGDVDGAIRSLGRQLRRNSGVVRAVIAEVLAPILLMRHDNEKVDELVRFIEEVGWLASANALRSLASADRGNVEQARTLISAAENDLLNEYADASRIRVLQRLARASLLIGDYERAIDLAASGAAIATSLGAWRAAAANYSVAYSVHHDATGQNDEARHYASMWYEAAKRASDASFVAPALIADYEMTVQFGDDRRLRILEEQMRVLLLPQQ